MSYHRGAGVLASLYYDLHMSPSLFEKVVGDPLDIGRAPIRWNWA